jgi:uncharacterized protein YndB with AHSA1/START domain
VDGPGTSDAGWGPKGFTSPTCKVDLRVGGSYLYCMRSPDGKDFWGTGVYHEIVPPERIVYTDSFADENGRVVPATHYGMNADIPREMLVTVTFEEQDGKTKLTLRHAGIPAGPDREGAKQGWGESFDKLAEYVAASRPSSQGIPRMTLATASDREIVMERVFAAPREHVFQAYTDPKAIPRWWGPRGTQTIVDRLEVRPGGAWRFVQRMPDGSETGFHGVIREIVAPQRIVQTFEWEGMPGHVVVDTVMFEGRPDGTTKVIVRSRFDTKEDRDGMLQSGMEAGARESYDRLEELLLKGV